jgi:hypothetical protein
VFGAQELEVFCLLFGVCLLFDVFVLKGDLLSGASSGYRDRQGVQGGERQRRGARHDQHYEECHRFFEQQAANDAPVYSHAIGTQVRCFCFWLCLVCCADSKYDRADNISSLSTTAGFGAAETKVL